MEKQFNKAKEALQHVTAPASFEAQIAEALEVRSKRKTKNNWQIYLVSAALFIVCIFVYQFPAFAYYSKQLFGFDEIMSGSISTLNEAGYGQVVDQSITLSDGTTVTIDGVMADANQFLLFYTVDDGNWEMPIIDLDGFFVDKYAVSQVGVAADDATGWKYIARFDSVHGFAKNLTVSFGGLGEVSFPYNANEALKAVRKVNIRETIHSDLGQVTFQSLIASPTQTVITGKLSRGIAPYFDSEFVKLYVNNELTPIDLQSSSVSSNILSSFTIAYDALPEEINSLKIVVEKLPERMRVEQVIDLQTGSASIGEHELEILDFYNRNGQAHIDIATMDELFLENVQAIGTSGKIPLSETLNTHIQSDGKKQRTITFDQITINEIDSLSIESIRWMKNVNEVLPIKVN